MVVQSCLLFRICQRRFYQLSLLDTRWFPDILVWDCFEVIAKAELWKTTQIDIVNYSDSKFEHLKANIDWDTNYLVKNTCGKNYRSLRISVLFWRTISRRVFNQLRRLRAYFEGLYLFFTNLCRYFEADRPFGNYRQLSDDQLSTWIKFLLKLVDPFKADVPWVIESTVSYNK